MPNNPPAGTPTPNSAAWHWATARGFDLKAPHWDDLTPEIQEAVRRVVHNLTYITRTFTSGPSLPDEPAHQGKSLLSATPPAQSVEEAGNRLACIDAQANPNEWGAAYLDLIAAVRAEENAFAKEVIKVSVDLAVEQTRAAVRRATLAKVRDIAGRWIRAHQIDDAAGFLAALDAMEDGK